MKQKLFKTLLICYFLLHVPQAYTVDQLIVGLNNLKNKLQELTAQLKSSQVKNVDSNAEVKQRAEQLLEKIDASPRRFILFRSILEQIGARPPLPPREDEEILAEDQLKEQIEIQNEFMRIWQNLDDKAAYDAFVQKIEELMDYVPPLPDRDADEEEELRLRYRLQLKDRPLPPLPTQSTIPVPPPPPSVEVEPKVDPAIISALGQRRKQLKGKSKEGSWFDI